MIKEVVKTNEKIKHAKLLIWAGFFMYVFMMASKNVYTAEVAAIQIAFSSGKAETSLAMTFYFVTYAIGQFIIAPIFSKINLKIYLSVTAGISAILTLIIGVAPRLELIYLICTLTGALQAGIYGGVMGIISKYAPKSLLPFANKVMSSGVALSSCIAYGTPVIFVAYGLWNVPFFLLGATFFISAVLFFISAHKMGEYPPEVVEEKGKIVTLADEKPLLTFNTKKQKSGVLFAMYTLSFLRNAMHYSIMQWTPSLLIDKFGMPLDYSILITLLVPVAMFVFSFVAISLCEKFRNIFKVGSLIFAIALAFMLPMTFACDYSMVLSIICLVVFIALTNSTTTIFSSTFAFKMRTQIKTGTFLTIINAIASILAGIAPTVAGKIIESSGYSTLYNLVFVFGILFLSLFVFLSKYLSNKSVDSLQKL